MIVQLAPPRKPGRVIKAGTGKAEKELLFQTAIFLRCFVKNQRA